MRLLGRSGKSRQQFHAASKAKNRTTGIFRRSCGFLSADSRHRFLQGKRRRLSAAGKHEVTLDRSAMYCEKIKGHFIELLISNIFG